MAITFCTLFGIAGVLAPRIMSHRVEIAKYKAQRARDELLTEKLKAIQREGVELETLRAFGVLDD
jgi:hypothetical protein